MEPVIYSWGKNKNGQLSLGHSKLASTPQMVKGVKSGAVRYINPGRKHTALIKDNGDLYVTGSSLHGKD